MSAADLRVEGASFSKGKNRPPLLHPTSFHLPAGRVMGIVGANGAGKTTLLRMIYRYAKPTTGRVTLGGDDIWALQPRAAARKVAAVLQEQPTDFALTVQEVVMLGRLPHRASMAAPGAACAAAVAGAIERLELGGFARRSFGSLSGGERQRVMVARALAQAPELLVMDEPTNHLDIRHQLEVLRLIRDLDMTIVTTLHDLNMAAQICDDILLLQSGRPLGFGPPAQVLNPAHVSAAFGIEARQDLLQHSARTHLTFHLNSGPKDIL
ncbi:MAG: ABC transporter ATP-binding protein [Sulfitobacter sp.]